MLQMIYTSVATKKVQPVELKDLRETSRRNNIRDGITGMLLYEDGTFIQVLEGDSEVVTSTFERISKDPRHSKILLIARFELDERTFTDWEMGFFDASGGQLLKLPGYTSFLTRQTVELEEPRKWRQGSRGTHQLQARCLASIMSLATQRDGVMYEQTLPENLAIQALEGLYG